jgi:uncharacterized membrane protein YfcA
VFPFDAPIAAIVGIAIIVTGYTLFGVTGFGASLITIPVLSHFYPLPFVLVLAGLLDLGSGLVLGVQRRRDAAVSELRWLIPFAMFGAALGVTLLVNLPRDASLLGLGMFIGGYAIYGLMERGATHGIGQGWAPLAGTLGGIAGTLFGMGGPPYLIYLTRRVNDKNSLRATMSVMVIFSLVIRLVAFAIAGLLLQPDLDVALIWFLPAAAAGLWMGNRIHLSLPNAVLLRVLYFVLLACGLSLIGRALIAGG